MELNILLFYVNMPDFEFWSNHNKFTEYLKTRYQVYFHAMRLIIYTGLLFLVLYVATYNYYPKISDYGSIGAIVFIGVVFLLFNLVFNFTWLFVELKLGQKNKVTK